MFVSQFESIGGQAEGARPTESYEVLLFLVHDALGLIAELAGRGSGSDGDFATLDLVGGRELITATRAADVSGVTVSPARI